MKTPKSSAIKSLTYQSRTQNLYVHMRDGSTLVYRNVPQDVYEAFEDAPSKGHYYNMVIRDMFVFEYVAAANNDN